MEKPFSWKFELRSKLLDGALPGLAFYLLVMMVAMAEWPIEALFGTSGLLLLAVSLLGIAMFSLHRALTVKAQEPTRAWYGMAAGALAWAVASLTLSIDGTSIVGVSSVILLLLSGLVLGQLWQRSLETGGRFFMLTLLLQWGATLLAYYLGWLADTLPLPEWIQRSWIWVGYGAAAFIVVWMMVRSQTRLQRTGAALIAVTLLFFAFALGRG